MQMDSYYYQDDIPGFYQHGAWPELPPFGLDASSDPLPGTTTEAPSGSALGDHHYYYEAPAGGMDGIAAWAQQGSGGQDVQGMDMFGGMEVELDQCQLQAKEEEEQEDRCQRQPAGSVESSRGFRHMMRERQRREKLSQSYADLYALVAARSKGDKNSIVQSAAVYIHELRCAREQLRRRNEELKDRILGHDARRPTVKLDFEVNHPAAAGVDPMIGALRRLKSMGVRARGIRSSMAGGRLRTEMNVETTIAACQVEKAVEEALLQEVERNQRPDDSGAASFPGTSSGSSSAWGGDARAKCVST